jgi:hypothetical protein
MREQFSKANDKFAIDDSVAPGAEYISIETVMRQKLNEHVSDCRIVPWEQSSAQSWQADRRNSVIWLPI